MLIIDFTVTEFVKSLKHADNSYHSMDNRVDDNEDLCPYTQEVWLVCLPRFDRKIKKKNQICKEAKSWDEQYYWEEGVGDRHHPSLCNLRPDQEAAHTGRDDQQQYRNNLHAEKHLLSV